jgi:hypothetical protein
MKADDQKKHRINKINLEEGRTKDAGKRTFEYGILV